MPLRKVQMSFNSGELSPAMYGRYDDKGYGNGLAVCRNFICLPQGPAVSRPGFEYVRETKYAGKASRLIPFRYSSTQTMALEFGEGYIRFHTQGKTLLGADGEPYEIESPYAAEDLFGIHYVQSADVMTLVHTKYPPMELRRYGATDWRLAGVFFEAPIAAPAAPAVTYTCGDDKAERKDAYTLKYKVTALITEDGIVRESEASPVGQVKGNLYISNSYTTISWTAVEGAERYRVYKSYKGIYGYIGETAETELIDDNYEADESNTPPRYDDLIFATYGGIKTATVTDGGSGYLDESGGIAPLAGSFLFSNSKKSAVEIYAMTVQRNTPPDYPSITLTVQDTTGSGAVLEPVLEQTMESETRTEGDSSEYTRYTATTKLKGYTVKAKGKGYTAPYISFKTAYDGRVIDSGSYTSTFELPVERSNATVEVSDPTGYGAVLTPVISDGKVTAVKIERAGYGYTAPTATVKSEVGSGATVALTAAAAGDGDYPGAVCYYEQRRFFGGTPAKPQMIWATRSGTESDMSYHLPVLDDDRIKFRIAAQEASRVEHLIPISRMIALTDSSEFQITSVNSDALTPSSISVKPQSYIGASEAQPVIVGNQVVYPAARGGHLRELGYVYQAGGFVSGDLSLKAEHLFQTDAAVDLALMKAPDSIVWAAMKSGALLGFTYLPEQSVGAWHRHDTQNGLFESVCCVTEGDEDILYAVVQREIGGELVRFVERMRERFYEDIADAFCVDCGAAYESETPVTYLSGLDWLEGEEVAILADGLAQPHQTVTDGAICFDSPVSKIRVGLPVVCDIQTLPAQTAVQDGSYGTGHMKNINDVWLRVYRSAGDDGCRTGPSFDRLVPVSMRTENPYEDTRGKLVSDEIFAAQYAEWNADGQICLRLDSPLPLQVISLAVEYAA